MWLFGVSLFTALLPSFFSGLGVLASTYLLGRTLWDRNSALMATAILASSGIFFLASHSARPDLLFTLYWVTALYLMAGAPPGNWAWRFVAAGAVMGFSGDVHLNGFLLTPIPFLFWLALRPESVRLRGLVALIYFGAVLVGVVFWLAFHYWSNPEAFIQQIQLMGGRTHGVRISNLGFWGSLHGEIKRYLTWFWKARGHRHLLEGLIIFGCGSWMAWWGERKDRALVVAWSGVFGVGILLMANLNHWYFIYVWPLFALWVSRGLCAIGTTVLHIWAKAIFYALLATNLLNLALWAGKAYSGPPYVEISRELHALIPPDASVIAGGEWWFTFHDQDFTDAQSLYFRGLEREGSFEDWLAVCWETEWRRFHWEFVVASSDVQTLLDPEVPISTANKLIGVERVAREVPGARSFTKNHGHILRRIPTSSTPVLVMKVRRD